MWSVISLRAPSKRRLPPKKELKGFLCPQIKSPRLPKSAGRKVKSLANLNRIILVGSLTADAETRATIEGIPVSKFRLAVNRPAANGASETDFIDVVAWRKLAEASAEHLKKGQLVLVEGRIQNRSFEDQTGQRRWITEVVAKGLNILGAAEVSGAMSKNLSDLGPGTEHDEEPTEDSELISDLPF
ncbi:single-stranded DNA-binding protein [Candidatus Saganbacteria bacterium]|uniref:Single-stranded DNA-binding protein n=1 Tax=Candidatus Saganbacteria bacterium TaxID=2575572 RepID=A0A9D6YXF9_UNCSA|nr:single-stranded DNA-binding protein [Candidatus Saganbacteria bacterium]